MTQKEMVLDMLKTNGSITSWEAFTELGTTRLSGRIFDLKKDGYEIEKENITRKNRYGHSVTFAKYTLKA